MRRAWLHIGLAIAWMLAVVGLAMAIAGASSCGKVKRNVEETFVDDPILPHRFPLTVAADPMLDERVLEEDLELFNDAAGCTLFAKEAAGDVADVVIDFDAPPTRADGTKDDCAQRCDPRHHLGCTCFGADGWAIFYPTPSTIDVDMWVIAHELSHVLGLAHDVGRKNAVTRPDAHRGPADGAMFLLTTKDGNALAERYCKDRT